MAKKTITELKNYFKAGKRPTEGQFGDVMDSFANLEDPQLFPKNYFEKRLSLDFPHNVADQAVDILLGNRGMSGRLEIEIVGTWMYWNSVGNIKKLFQVGFNPDNGVWYTPTSRIVEAAGLITNHIYIGDIVWDAAINQYKIPIYHTHFSGNIYDVRITYHCPFDTQDLSEVKLSDVYTNALTGQRVHHINYNYNLGVGTSLPETSLHVMAPKDKGHSNVVGAMFDRNEAAGGSNIVQLKYHSTADLELNSLFTGTNFRYGSYGDFNIVNNIDDGTYGAINIVTNKQTRLSIMPNGNIGIGTVNPISKLDVRGNIVAGITDATEGINAFAIRYENGSVNNWGSLRSGAETYMSYGVKADNKTAYGWLSGSGSYPSYKTAVTTGNDGIRFLSSAYEKIAQDSPVTMSELMRITPGGNVGIGTRNPDQKLTVKGKIHAEDVIVDMNVPADYVFQKYFDGESSLRPDYQMPTLQKLEAFVKENKHLPEIPSGDAIKKDGVNLGDFQMKLLQKIEELTLYVISQNKEIENLKAIIEK
ncbi:hypothetical protein BBH99_04050 [Chryseobacterium contaminans]|uniref:Chaperone of endosialidase n=1 Tax=Chryseobacterium contaminans TaxID=1423959 RepID=A0A1M7A0L3_9FLAO|nr:hypothetical protein [Chryseobacterium contaminans]OCA80506.1 hypothetical protein BBH99_04050 [Chryseobacterium contaminans]SHL36200.1 hypothetical protein SAMN05444407_103438 [Chryseobacterium contaminans]